MAKHSLRWWQAVAVAGVVGLTACDDDAIVVHEPDFQVTSIDVSPSQITLNYIGEEGQFAATLYDEDGNDVTNERDAFATWSSADSSVVHIRAGDGLVTATLPEDEEENEILLDGPQTVEIWAEAGGEMGRQRAHRGRGDVTESATVIVDQIPEAMTLEPGSLSLEVGETADLSATVLDEGGTAIGYADVSFSSGDASVATVDADGVVEAVGEGETTITASGDGVAASATVEVTSGQ